MKAHKARLPKDDYSEVAAMFQKLRTKNAKRKSKQTRKSWKTRSSGSASDSSSSDNEKHARCCINWRDTQECYRCHKVGHIARYCLSTAPVESGAPTETAVAAMTMTTTSIENYWMIVANRESPSKESWNLDCATTTHICGDWRKFKRYAKYTRRDAREIRDCARSVAGKVIRHGAVRLRLWLPGGCKNQVGVRNVLYVEEAQNSLSQSRLMDRGLQIVPVNGYGITIYDKAPAESTGQGRGNPVGVARQIGPLFRLDVWLEVKVARKSHRATGRLFRRSTRHGLLPRRSCSCGWSFGRSFRQVLSLVSLEFSTTVVVPPWRSVGTDLSAVITWVGLGCCAAEPHRISSCVCVN